MLKFFLIPAPRRISLVIIDIFYNARWSNTKVNALCTKKGLTIKRISKKGLQFIQLPPK